MKVFLAGASGVIGLRLIPLLQAAGHDVTGTTRSPAKLDLIRELGATPVLCDVFDSIALQEEVVRARPDLVMHQLTDLPDDPALIGEFRDANARIRREGTSNLLTAARAAGAERFVAQSVAHRLPGDAGEAVADMERMVHESGGVVIRYGRFYGPGTHYPEPPTGPAIHIDEAANRTLDAIDHPGSTLTLVTRCDP